MSSSEVETSSAPESPPFALLFELEYVAVEGRKAIFDVLTSILSENSVELSPVVFSKNCLQSPPARYIENLLDEVGARKLSSDKVLQDVNSGIAMYYSSNEVKLSAGLDSLLKIARDRSVTIAAISGAPQNIAEGLMVRLGLADKGIELITFNGADYAAPRADTWLKITKSLEKPPRNCLALISSAAACKSALSAGIRCVAIPDQFTSFQDFGGTDTVIDSYEGIDFEALLNFAFPEPAAS